MDNEKTPAQLWDGVRDLHDHLAAGDKGYEQVPGHQQDDGLFVMGWIRHEDWLWHGIWDGINLLDTHLHGDWKPYYDHLNNDRVPLIPQATRDELTAWFILLGNRERIVEGLIASFVDSGAILKLTTRFFELVERPES